MLHGGSYLRCGNCVMWQVSVITITQDERFRPYPHPGEEFIPRKSRKHPTRYQVSVRRWRWSTERSREKTESRRRGWEWAAGKGRTTEPSRRAEGSRRSGELMGKIWEMRNFNASSDEKASAGSRVSTEYRGEVWNVPLMSCLKEIESRPAVNKEEISHICPSPLASREVVKPSCVWLSCVPLPGFLGAINTNGSCSPHTFLKISDVADDWDAT